MNILTLKVDTKYSADYVNRLYQGIKRNTSVDFKFYCYTEDPTGLLPNILVVPLENPKALKLQWHKLNFHQAKFANIPIGEKCLILDIDWIVINNIDEILSYSLLPQHLGCFERWWSNRRQWCKLNGGFQMFYMGDTNYLYETFIEQPEYWQEYFINKGEADGPVNGEQNFIDMHTKHKQWLPMEWFAKYGQEDDAYQKIQSNWHTYVNSYDPFFFDEEFAESIKMVHFSDSENLIHKYDERWIKDYWK